MTRADAAFAGGVARALAAPLDGPLGARFPGAAVTAIAAAAEAGEQERLEPALAGVRDALAAHGVPVGRQFVLLASGTGLPVAARAHLSGTLGIPVLEHHPDGASFRVGRTLAGAPLEFSDELREAEALVLVGRAGVAGIARGGPFILCPGLASALTAAAFEACLAEGGLAAAFAFAREAERALPVQLALLWDKGGRVVAGGGRERFAAIAAGTGRP